MEIVLRVLLSVIGVILAFAISDYYFDGTFKYILWGVTAAVVFLYNEKKNREHKKSMDG